jgi:hypothetical protein
MAAQVFVREITLERPPRLAAELEEAGAESVTFALVAERGPQAVRQLAQAVLTWPSAAATEEGQG